MIYWVKTLNLKNFAKSCQIWICTNICSRGWRTTHFDKLDIHIFGFACRWFVIFIYLIAQALVYWLILKTCFNLYLSIDWFLFIYAFIKFVLDQYLSNHYYILFIYLPWHNLGRPSWEIGFLLSFKGVLAKSQPREQSIGNVDRFTIGVLLI